MVSTLLEHGFKRFTRSVSFSKDLATTLFLGFFSLMIGGYLLALGLFLDKIIIDGLKQADPIAFLHRILIYFFFLEFLVRYLFQNLPVLDIQPYLHLPIKKGNIIHFLLSKSIVHVMNVFVLLIFTPFAFSVVGNTHGIGAAFAWIGTLWFFSLSVHYIVILLKVKLDDSFWGVACLIAVFTFLGVADHYGWVKLSDVSFSVFGLSLGFPWLLLIAIGLTAGLYFTIFLTFQRKCLYR